MTNSAIIVRDKMLAYRREHHLTLNSISRIAGVSEALVAIVEDGGITNPGLAKRIGKAYELTTEEIETLHPPMAVWNAMLARINEDPALDWSNLSIQG